ncbi:MAG TPA: universal stress protein [Bacteroidota bacterium]|nr:universal stress protein [Bacteroidota bacterium]
MAKIKAKKASGTKRGKSNVSRIELNRILVPIDFSEHSKKALKYAIPFARQFTASIDLIYVVEPTIYPADFSFGQVGFPNVEEELRKRGAMELDSLIKKEIAGRVKARQVIRTGKPFYEIIQYAREEKMDLIIIATHGHTGVEQILFGSTAEKVVRKAPCPVLVVRTGEREFIRQG